MQKRFLKLDDANKIAFIYEAPEAVSENEDIFNKPAPSPTKPLILMVPDYPDAHGLTKPDGFYAECARVFAEADCPTMRFDFRGCGDSSGAEKDLCIETAVQDLKAVIHWAKAKHGHDRIAIMAAGLGCAVTVTAYDPDIISHVVFLWPVLRPMETPLHAIDSKDHKDFMTDNDMTVIDGCVVGLKLANELRQMDLVPYLQKIRAVTQLQQGTADSYSPYDTVEAMRAHIPGLRDFCVFEGGEHALPKRTMRRHAMQNALFFINKYSGRKPDSFYTYVEEEFIIRNIS